MSKIIFSVDVDENDIHSIIARMRAKTQNPNPPIYVFDNLDDGVVLVSNEPFDENDPFEGIEDENDERYDGLDEDSYYED